MLQFSPRTPPLTIRRWEETGFLKTIKQEAWEESYKRFDFPWDRNVRTNSE